MSAQEIASNFWGAVGLFIGGASGVVIALIKTKKSTVDEVSDLRAELEDLQENLASLKKAFTLVFDEMERREELPQQLKDFKKMFDL
jgi:cell shape-determining protein MreC